MEKLDLTIDIQQVIKSVTLKKTVLSLAVSLGIFGTLTPLLFKQLDRESKTLFLLAGMIGNTTACLLPRDTKDEKIKVFHEKISLENYRKQLGHEVFRINAVTEVRERNLLADFVDNDAKVPAFQKSFWANKFGVTPLVTSFFVNKETESTEQEEASTDKNMPISLPAQSLTKQLELVSSETQINLDWIPGIVPQSKILVGGRGAGKSRFMRFLLASYITNYPTDEWFVVDPHYEGYEDDFDYNNPDQAWLLGIPAEQLRAKIFDNVTQGYALLMQVKATLKDRISRKLKYPKVPRIMMFMDELEAFRRDLNDEQFNELIDLIEVVQDEGRKFGVELTIGCHALKKERIGIDSTVLSQMTWLLLEKAATDSTTKYPADFNQKSIIKEVKKVNQRKDKTKHKTLVMTTPTGDLLVDLLPLLPLPSFSVNGEPEPSAITPTPQELTPAQKAFTAIRQWVNDRQLPPTAEEVRQAWEKLTGEQLHEQGLRYLIEKLGL